LYVGYTPDLKRRIAAHNTGKAQATRLRKPLQLLYYEAYGDERDARKREKFFKSGWGRNYVKKQLRHTLMSTKI